MPLDVELGKKMLQLITSRYDDRHWRKRIEKTLSLPQSGVTDPIQQQIFIYLKLGLKAYKSRRADPDSWILGGYATKEVIDRAKFQPHLVGPTIKKDDVVFLGGDLNMKTVEFDKLLLADWKAGKPVQPRPIDQDEVADNAPHAGYGRPNAGWSRSYV
mgnify:CR=1 FL=1